MQPGTAKFTTGYSSSRTKGNLTFFKPPPTVLEENPEDSILHWSTLLHLPLGFYLKKRS
jgi:hypothetical protein